ncbi:helix-turn-helix domain-containing protein [Chitinophaga sp. CF418]|uniref:helix-turn-helix domain-containing protein n=1 Tax=Chitinophaga sp. CF418 TaxID=1855287 RepID=UPI00122CBC16|nr:helix-turn-helix transcriptional regulator [Chitinophaga sp. CF418]
MGVTAVDQYVIDKVRKMRTERGMSQDDLALEMGVSQGFVAMVESPKFNQVYSVAHINKIALIFDCSPRTLLPSHAIPEDGEKK